MSNHTIYTNYVAAIVQGTATSTDINNEPCDALSIQDKQSLLNLLAQREADKVTGTSVLTEMKGEQVGGTLDVGSFFYGAIYTVDTNNTAQVDEAGTTQFVTDSDNDVLAEASAERAWAYIPGRHHKARTFTIPAGVKVRYLFTLA